MANLEVIKVGDNAWNVVTKRSLLYVAGSFPTLGLAKLAMIREQHKRRQGRRNRTLGIYPAW